MRRADLVSDCGSCAALCCVATSFDASHAFAFAKPAGVACPLLMADHRCSIHGELVPHGCAGCAAYECYGAGPRVTRAFADDHDAEQRNQAFLLMRDVHELLWLLTHAADLCPPSERGLLELLRREVDVLDPWAAGPVAAIVECDVARHHRVTHTLLRRVGHALGGRRAEHPRLRQFARAS